LKNSAQTSLTAANASVIVGPFGSNGGSRAVSLGYSYNFNVAITNTLSYTGTPAATVIIERLDGGTWVQIGFANITGTVSGEDGFGTFEPGYILIGMGGSISLTDVTGGTSIQYRGRITSRTLPSINSTTQGQATEEQSVSVLSVEE
jgi:hypothetical protein